MENTNNQEKKELTYEEALKAFKAEWAEKRANERKQKSAKEKVEEREKDIKAVKPMLSTLESLSAPAKKELSAVIIRLNMFVKGERYTRKGGNK